MVTVNWRLGRPGRTAGGLAQLRAPWHGMAWPAWLTNERGPSKDTDSPIGLGGGACVPPPASSVAPRPFEGTGRLETGWEGCDETARRTADDRRGGARARAARCTLDTGPGHDHRLPSGGDRGGRPRHLRGAAGRGRSNEAAMDRVAAQLAGRATVGPAWPSSGTHDPERRVTARRAWGRWSPRSWRDPSAPGWWRTRSCSARSGPADGRGSRTGRPGGLVRVASPDDTSPDLCRGEGSGRRHRAGGLLRRRGDGGDLAKRAAPSRDAVRARRGGRSGREGGRGRGAPRSRRWWIIEEEHRPSWDRCRFRPVPSADEADDLTSRS